MAKKCACGEATAPRRTICYKCRTRGIRAKDPIRAIYYDLKRSAKKRNYEFAITLEYFKNIATEAKLVENRGRHAHSFTVDRIKNELGYIQGNIQILTRSENCTKYHDEMAELKKTMNVIIEGEEYEHPF